MCNLFVFCSCGKETVSINKTLKSSKFWIFDHTECTKLKSVWCMETGHNCRYCNMLKLTGGSTGRLCFLERKQWRRAERCLNRPNSRCTKSSIMSFNYQNYHSCYEGRTQPLSPTPPTTFPPLHRHVYQAFTPYFLLFTNCFTCVLRGATWIWFITLTSILVFTVTTGRIYYV